MTCTKCLEAWHNRCQLKGECGCTVCGGILAPVAKKKAKQYPNRKRKPSITYYKPKDTQRALNKKQLGTYTDFDAGDIALCRFYLTCQLPLKEIERRMHTTRDRVRTIQKMGQ